jgi:hypothetical protein
VTMPKRRTRMPAHPLPIGGHQIGHQKDTDDAGRHIHAHRHHVQTPRRPCPMTLSNEKENSGFLIYTSIRPVQQYHYIFPAHISISLFCRSSSSESSTWCSSRCDK